MSGNGWPCGCGMRNPLSRFTCLSCRLPRGAPSTSGQAEAAGKSEFKDQSSAVSTRKPYFTPDDEVWYCVCGTMNFSYRYSCYHCKLPKGAPSSSKPEPEQNVPSFSTKVPTNARFVKYQSSKRPQPSKPKPKPKPQESMDPLRVTINLGSRKQCRVVEVFSPEVARHFIQKKMCYELDNAKPHQMCIGCLRHLETGRVHPCRFINFRIMEPDPNENTFRLDAESPTERPLFELPGESLDKGLAQYVLETLLYSFRLLYNVEMECIVDLTEDSIVPWKPYQKHANEKCDVCNAHFFNFHLMCEYCGFAVCFPCSQGEQLHWQLCHNDQIHVLEELQIVKLLPKDELTELYAKVLSLEPNIPTSDKSDGVKGADDLSPLRLASTQEHLFSEEMKKGNPTIVTGMPIDPDLCTGNKIQELKKYLHSNYPLPSYTLSTGKYNLLNWLSHSSEAFVNSNAKDMIRKGKCPLGRTTILRSHSTDFADFLFLVKDNSNDVGKEKAAAFWQVWKADDADMLRKAVKKLSPDDKINYIDEEMVKVLRDQYNIFDYQFVQYEGDCVIIPAGCVSQVRMLAEVIGSCKSFMSPESVSKSLHVGNKMFNLKGILYNAVKTCAEVLSSD